MNNKTKKMMVFIGVITTVLITVVVMDDFVTVFMEGWNNPS